MLVYFDEIPPLGRDFAWLITTLEADTDCTLDAPLEAHCHIDPAGQGSVHIEGRLRGVVTLGCDRCLVSYLLQLDTSFQVKAMVHSVDMESQRPGILESGLENFETVACETPCIHLDELMRQQLLLALPEKRLCCSDCAGLCPHCGVNRNEEACECSQNAGQSPFAALAGWVAKKRHNN